MEKHLKGSNHPWTQQELDLLHEMVQEYDFAKRVRKRAIWWITTLLGLPAAALMVWEPLVRLWKLFKGG